MQPMNQDVYREFLGYCRQMFADIASAHTGAYPNNRRLQEVVVVWNPAEMPLEGYPHPENITHIRALPHVNGIECGEYVFKDILCRLMQEAGYKAHDRMFISETRGDEFSCNMASGYADRKPACAEEDGGSEIYYIMIRSNRDLGKALNFFKTLDDSTLDRVARAALGRLQRVVGVDPPLPQTSFPAGPAP